MRLPVRLSAPFLVLLLFCSAVAGASAQAAGTLSGRVVDPDGRPVAGARLLLVSGHTVAASARSAEDGRFLLAPPAEGTYILRAAAEGFRAAPVTVTVTASPSDLGTLPLQVSAIAEAVVVSAAQVEVPLATAASAVTVITGEELETRQYESVAEALRTVPGLTVATSGSRGSLTSVFPRGGESDYTLVIVDGVQANSFGGGFDFAHLPVSNIERIEIVRGPQSALYGANAIGSVVRIVTRRGGPARVNGSIEAGSFGTARLTAGASGAAGGVAWGVSGERLTSDGLNGSRTAAGDPVTNDHYARGSAGAAASWSSSRGASVRGDLRYAQDERGAPGPFGTDPGGTFSGINSQAFGTADRLLAGAGASLPIGSALKLHGTVTHARTDSTFTDVFNGHPSAFDTWSRRTAARLQGDRALTRALELSAGAELLRERGGSTFIVADGPQVPVERSLRGLFGEGRWNHAERLFVTAGIRLEQIVRERLAPDQAGLAARPELPQDSVLSANPRLAAAWHVRSGGGKFTRVRASTGTGIRAPDAFELAFTDNPSLRPERSRSVDAGLDHAFADGRVLLESTLFFNDFDDLIVAVGSFRESSRYRTDNISNARSHGLELAGTARGRAGRVDLQLRTAYTRLATRILAADRATAAPSPFMVGDRLLRRPAHQLSADLVAAIGPLQAFVRGGGRSAVRDVDPSWGTFGGMFDAPGYVSWDAGASVAFLSRARLIGRITNILDRRYEETLGYPAPGRGAFLGLRIASHD